VSWDHRELQSERPVMSAFPENVSSRYSHAGTVSFVGIVRIAAKLETGVPCVVVGLTILCECFSEARVQP